MGISVGESKRNHRGASSKHKSGMHGQSLGWLLGQAGDDDGKWRLCAQREEPRMQRSRLDSISVRSIDRKSGRVHLCSSKPCGTTEEYAMHVTRLRIFSVETFDRPYMNAYMKKQLGKWQGDEVDEVGDEAIDVSNGKEGEEVAEGPLENKAPGPQPLTKQPTAPAPAAAAGGDGGDPKKKGLKIGEEEKLKLRQRLDEARARMLKDTVNRGAGHEADAGYPAQEGRAASSKHDYTPSLAHTADLDKRGRPALEDASVEEALRKMGRWKRATA